MEFIIIMFWFSAGIAVTLAVFLFNKVVIKSLLKSKSMPISQDEIIKYTIDDVKILNEINPIVKEIYLLFVSKDGAKYFQERACTILISNLEIEFWHSNTIYDRHFTKIPDNYLKDQCKTMKEINNTLSIGDKKILDYIAKAVIVNNEEFISRLFI